MLTIYGDIEYMLTIYGDIEYMLTVYDDIEYMLPKNLNNSNNNNTYKQCEYVEYKTPHGIL